MPSNRKIEVSNQRTESYKPDYSHLEKDEIGNIYLLIFFIEILIVLY